MNKILLIIKREYSTRVKNKTFIIMTLVGPILLAGFFSLVVWLSLGEEKNHNVLVVDETPGSLFHNSMKNRDNISYFYTDTNISDREFEESPYSLMLYLNERAVENEVVMLYYKKAPSLRDRGKIKADLEQVYESIKLIKHELDEATYAQIKTLVNFKVFDIKDSEEEALLTEQAAIGFFFAIAIYMFIFIYGVQVMRGVIEEKSNRIVEVIISSVKPFHLMIGKITGIALVALTQFVLWIALTMILSFVLQSIFFASTYDAHAVLETAQKSSQLTEQVQPISNEVKEANKYMELFMERINWPLMLGMFAFYFLGGYLLYASLFAAVGAAVDNDTDTQQFMMPLTLPLIFGFVVAQMSIENPDGAAAFWSSIIPFTSPVVMMPRVAIGFDGSNVWELYLSMALLIAGFLFTTWIAGKIYRTGILMYGKKVNYKELWKWLRY